MDSTDDGSHVDFHLVIPCFNESDRLPSYLRDLVSLLSWQDYRTAIVIVDDGSDSREQDKVRSLVLEFANCGISVACLCLPNNMGKGYAVRHGWGAATSTRWLAFADADGAVPADEVARVFGATFREADMRQCYLGSRVRMLGRSVDRHWKRHAIGRLYATLVGLAINENIYDSQCGFKVIPASAFTEVSRSLQEDRFAFDAELIAALSDAGYSLKEIAVDWRDVPGSKVSLIRDSIRMARSLLIIRGRKQRGAFRRPSPAAEWISLRPGNRDSPPISVTRGKPRG